MTGENNTSGCTPFDKWNEMPKMDEDAMFDPCVDPWDACYGLGGFIGYCRCNQEHTE